MTTILTELYNDSLSQQASPGFDHRLETVRVFLEEHPSHHLNIDMLVDMARLSPKYFSNLFKQQYGITPKGYLVKARYSIDQAQEAFEKSAAFGAVGKAVISWE